MPQSATAAAPPWERSDPLSPDDRAAARHEVQELVAELAAVALAFRAVADRVVALERLLRP